MAATYKVLSALLSYPTAELQAASGELSAVLNEENLIPRASQSILAPLIVEIADSDLLELQARYVELFDRTRALSLHLFEHVYGESRDRGQAIVALAQRYHEAGLEISARELPDFIPLFLEYLSLLPPQTAAVQLGETSHILAALAERLERRRTNYSAVLQVLVGLAAAEPDTAVLSKLRETEIEDPNDLAALDRAWADSEVTFQPSGDECPKARDILDRIGASGPERIGT